MTRELWIRIAFGVVGAAVLLGIAIAQDVPLTLPFWAIWTLALLMPAARYWGSSKARQSGRRLRERRGG